VDDFMTQRTTDSTEINMTTNEPSFVLNDMMSRGRERNSRLALATLLGTPPRFDLACLGISIRGLSALTCEAITYLATADIVYCYPTTGAHLELVKLLNSNVINMHETLYCKGRPFDPTYSAIIKDVMAVVRSGKRVAYATQGSPAFHCGTAVALHRTATREGFRSILISGVSSFELLSAQLALHYDIRNISIVCIMDLMNQGVNLNPEAPSLLFDLGRYVLPAVRESVASVDRFKLDAFAARLRSAYPTDHEVILMYIGTDGRCLQEKTKLCDLENMITGFIALPTIFVPAMATSDPVE
jgi:precorrin-6B methylase 1